jgi:hypothetical protein
VFHYTRLERLARDKHSSLLRYGSFIVQAPVEHCHSKKITIFFSRIYFSWFKRLDCKIFRDLFFLKFCFWFKFLFEYQISIFVFLLQIYFFKLCLHVIIIIKDLKVIRQNCKIGVIFIILHFLCNLQTCPIRQSVLSLPSVPSVMQHFSLLSQFVI